MGLPKNIPASDGELSAADRPLPAARATKPRVAAQPPRREPEVDPELREFEEFQKWKQMKAAGATQSDTPARRTSKKAPAQSVQPSGPLTVAQLEHTRRIDPKTGVSYLQIPKTKMSSDGVPELAIDLDLNDLNGEADHFLGHLRIAPTREEREEILRKKAEIVKKQKADRDELNRSIDEKEGIIEEPDDDPYAEAPKKRGLFGRKS